MRVIIAGSRTISGPTAHGLILEAIQRSGWGPEITEILHGACRGIDEAADNVAAGRWPVRAFPAEWKKHGRKAGPMRNLAMALNADALILVWDGQSAGSASMKREAERSGLKVFELVVTDEQRKEW